MLRVSGPGAVETFEREGGGHRWQRVPPTEKRGRVQTSTITVAVLPEATAAQVPLVQRELEWGTCRSSGAGGQNVNKRDTAVWVKHLPTGVMVRCESERSQHQNRETALALLRTRLLQAEQERKAGARDGDRRRQVGSGMRGDKRRTIRTQDDSVVDQDGRSWRFADYRRGIW